MTLASIPDAVAQLALGRPVIVVDDEDRENEGDVVIAAELATQESIAWLVRNSSGFICAPMTDAIADRLDLPTMVTLNEDPRGTAYTVSVDAANRLSTGISAADRANTLRVLADPTSVPQSLNRPGHILPLRAVPGGSRARNGHTEAAVDLLKLAGLTPVAGISEIVAEDGEMMRLPGLLELGERDGVLVTSIEALVEYLNTLDPADDPTLIDSASDNGQVFFEVETLVPTTRGPLRMRAYRDRKTGHEHVAIVGGEPGLGALVRVHSECLTGEAFGSLKCECGPQLETALDAIAQEGGVVIYLRGHEGRGIGLINKLKAYRLQEDGLDTLDANLALDLPADSRDYGAAAAILEDLGIDGIKLLSNNPDKKAQLERHGITVSQLVPLIVGVSEFNTGYLETKAQKMGHEIHLEHSTEGNIA